jgi:PIN domain nuclease of toxin-antitoxin system
VKLLLDTHVLLWWLADAPVLSSEARAAIAQAGDGIFVSSATAWEIAIKKALGKLRVPDNLEEALSTSGLQELRITIAHAMAAGALPPHHADPFDRMLVAQATLENLTLVTRDERMGLYNVSTLRA